MVPNFKTGLSGSHHLKRSVFQKEQAKESQIAEWYRLGCDIKLQEAIKHVVKNGRSLLEAASKY